MPGPSGVPASTTRALLRQVPAVLSPTQGVAGLTAHRQCQWIDGQAHRDAAKCGAPASLGCSWCETHRRRVFITDMRPVEPIAEQRVT
jgi:hypothetical protein